MDQAQFDQLISRLDTLNKLLALMATNRNSGLASFKDLYKLFKTMGFIDDEILTILSCSYGEKNVRKMIPFE